MRIRLIVLAAVLGISSPAAAEAPKNLSAQTQQQPAQPQVAVLASADAVKAAPSDASQQARQKHRVARVTTCRCGDPEPADVSDGPEQ
ncbi:MAG TPA: hypothetical protein VID20_07070 [Sphingomicrobium sp.]|jgi:hypothetical protein